MLRPITASFAPLVSTLRKASQGLSSAAPRKLELSRIRGRMVFVSAEIFFCVRDSKALRA